VRDQLKRLLGRRGVAAIRRARVAGRRARVRLREGGRRHPALLIPASRTWGFDRGTAVDRYYIEDFLKRYAGDDTAPSDVRGRVLEFGGDEYSRRFGRPARGRRADGIERIDIMDLDPANENATIVGDLTDPGSLSTETFDCVICTEVLMLIYDVRAALANLYRSLRPGGVLLVTVAGISRRCSPDDDRGGDYWHFTSLSLRRLLEEKFPGDKVEIRTYGNVRAATAFLYGIAAEELSPAELDLRDNYYEVTVAARAVKPGAS
jgi:SAM-dependent methyltransferase